MGKEKAQKREKAAYPPIEYHHEESRYGRNKKGLPLVAILYGLYNKKQSLFLIKNRIGSRIVVHLHLAIHLHVLTPVGNIIQQLVDGRT